MAGHFVFYGESPNLPPIFKPGRRARPANPVLHWAPVIAPFMLMFHRAPRFPAIERQLFHQTVWRARALVRIKAEESLRSRALTFPTGLVAAT